GRKRCPAPLGMTILGPSEPHTRLVNVRVSPARRTCPDGGRGKIAKFCAPGKSFRDRDRRGGLRPCLSRPGEKTGRAGRRNSWNRKTRRYSRELRCRRG